MSRIHDISVKILKQPCAQDLAVELQRRGWLLSVLTLEDRLVWLQAKRNGRLHEAEVRGVTDLVNVCGVLKALVSNDEQSTKREAA